MNKYKEFIIANMQNTEFKENKSTNLNVTNILNKYNLNDYKIELSRKVPESRFAPRLLICPSISAQNFSL